MFVGHLAAALAAKGIAPRVPLATLVAAAFGLDLLWPLFLLAGLERVRIAPGHTRFTPLAFESYPWSHSLVLAVFWGIAGALAVRRGKVRGPVRLVVGATVVSHWVLDCVTHRPDLPLWPGGPTVGLGLWNSVAATLLVEGALLAGGVVLFGRVMRPRDAIGRWSFWGLLVFTGAIWLSGPWSPPPPSVTAIAVVGLALWIFPVWAGWIERHFTFRS